MIVGITGSIGSGKTTLAEVFRTSGFTILNADNIYHQLLEPESEVSRKLMKAFGEEILTSQGSIDRGVLKHVVFADSKKLKLLNAIAHPLILEEVKKKIRLSKTDVVIDAPLLVEAGFHTLCDTVIVVFCSKEVVMKRLGKSRTHAEVEAILKSQMPPEEKKKHADFVVDNSGNLSLSVEKIKEIIDTLKKPA